MASRLLSPSRISPTMERAPRNVCPGGSALGRKTQRASPSAPPAVDMGRNCCRCSCVEANSCTRRSLLFFRTSDSVSSVRTRVCSVSHTSHFRASASFTRVCSWATSVSRRRSLEAVSASSLLLRYSADSKRCSSLLSASNFCFSAFHSWVSCAWARAIASSWASSDFCFVSCSASAWYCSVFSRWARRSVSRPSTRAVSWRIVASCCSIKAARACSSFCALDSPAASSCNHSSLCLMRVSSMEANRVFFSNWVSRSCSLVLTISCVCKRSSVKDLMLARVDRRWSLSCCSR
mmetsp:Transcript_8152/g.14512  ORF Transcript_8152/g.14512 Transcript_8152/m.14512 type:complete len:292 (-) Transcript_8152:357-1232(-)